MDKDYYSVIEEIAAIRTSQDEWKKKIARKRRRREQYREEKMKFDEHMQVEFVRNGN
jgi:hypothetical protein